MSLVETLANHTTNVPPYLLRLVDLLRESMPEAWKWAASEDFAKDDAEAVRLSLLRSTVRLDRETHQTIYGLVETALERLGLEITATIYQQQNPVGWNAAAVPLDDSAHIILQGNLAKELAEKELLAVLAHEIGHVLLWKINKGQFRIAARLLEALSADTSATNAHLESARLSRVYTEVFCDRVSQKVVDDPSVVISALLKTGTQASTVDVDAYRKQAEEVLSASKPGTNDPTHPELSVRVIALQSWVDNQNDIEPKIEKLIEGQPELLQLDLIGQMEAGKLTRRVLDAIFRHKWFHTEAALAHAKLFFDDYVPAACESEQLDALADQIGQSSKSIQQYVAFLLLDFATTDRDLEDVPLAAAMELAQRFSLTDVFQDSARKELKLRVKQLQDLDKQKESLLSQAGSHD